jgi:hypothetical protein
MFSLLDLAFVAALGPSTAPQPEIFTVTAGADPSQTANLFGGGYVTYDSGGTITGFSVPGFSTVISGGMSNTTVTLEADATGDQADMVITSGPGSVMTDVQGSNDTPGVAEVWTVSVGGADGGVNTSLGAFISSTGGMITDVLPPAGASVTSGGPGSNSVTFTANSVGSISDGISSDGTGGAGLFVNVEGSDLVPGNKERFTYTTGGPTSSVNVFSIGGGSYNMASDAGLITSIDSVPGFTITDGGFGFDHVTFTADANGPVTDAAIVSGEATVSTIQQGA